MKSPIQSLKVLENFDKNIEKDFFEKLFWSQSKLVCGLDEAGRGCLAGPVVAAAVVLKPHITSSLLKDSKTISEKSRATAFEWIIKNCWYASATADVWDIEQENILAATKLAMRRAFLKLLLSLRKNIRLLNCIVIDSVNVDLKSCHPWLNKDLQVFNPHKAESLSSSVAAASIVAKVVRDSIVTQLSNLFESYAFEKHKGYGTAEHIEKIWHHRASIQHREKFVATVLKKMEFRSGSKQPVFKAS